MIVSDYVEQVRSHGHVLVCVSLSVSFINPCFFNPCFINPCFIDPCFINPCFINPCFINPCFINPCFINPCFINPCFINPCFINPCFINPCFINPCFINPCFINPCFISPCFINPCFINPGLLTHVLSIQSMFYHMPNNKKNHRGFFVSRACHASFCLHLRDTNMANSNGCQGRAHVGENTQYVDHIPNSAEENCLN